MQLSPERLSRQLAAGLAPVYTVQGGEPLQTRECVDAIRAAARQHGFGEHLTLEPTSEGDWAGIRGEVLSPSLFASRRLIEVRLPGSKPGEAGARVLTDLAAHPASDVVLLLVLGKLETRQRAAAWLEALDRAGVSILTRAVDPGDLPGWITARARRSSLELSEDAVRLLAERTEGNLLACDQEIEKLALLYPGGRVDLPQVLASSGDSSRHDVFDLVDSALAGDPGRSTRVLDGLRAEGVEPPLVVWALARELRTLASIARRVSLGEPLARLLGRYRVWEARRPTVRRALERHGPEPLLGFLRQLADIDRTAKGLAPGDPWLELSRLVLAIAGVRLSGVP